MRRMLLDTHVVLRWSLGDARLPSPVRDVLRSDDTVRMFSVASAWEISIKWSIGRLPLPEHPRAWTSTAVAELSLDVVLITQAHVVAVADLPHQHGDPFDRLLIAQAQVEGVPIVTADRRFAAYDVEVIDAR